MLNILLCYILFSVNTTPQNLSWDHYTIIPPLGRIKSVATSPIHVFVINDNYLLIFDKSDLTLKKTIHFDQAIHLVGYDHQYNDLWVLGDANIIRYNITSHSVREYSANGKIDRFGIGQDYLYLDGVKNYSFNKRSGALQTIPSFPGDVVWYKKTTDTDIKRYPFLTPYYYYDELQESQAPFSEFKITSIYDDGVDLYVGTDGYGILKYNKISWQKERVIYGPLDLRIKKIKKFDNKIYFVSSLGISHYPVETGNWHYQRYVHEIADLLFLDNRFIISFKNQISQADGGIILSISNFATDVLSLNSDDTYIYVGTNAGLFRMFKGTNLPMPFGPDRFAVYAVYTTKDAVFVGGEFAFYSYSKEKDSWSKVLPYGVKDIIEIGNDLYLLSLNNQLIKYGNDQHSLQDTDTNWILLPYFNIYDIDTDNEVLYCASYAGVYYYEPDTDLYKVVFDFPRIKYNYVFVVDDTIVAVSDKNIYSLPIKYRD